jgi:penicillin-binding protein 2
MPVLNSRRFLIFQIAALVIFVVLIGQLWQLQMVASPQYLQSANRNRFRLVPTSAPRGVIYDRQGRVLVRNIPRYVVTVVPADLPEKQEDQVIARLAQLLKLPATTSLAERAVASRGGAADPGEPPETGIREQIDAARKKDPFSPVRIATDVDRDVALIIEEEKLDLPGVHIVADPVREYPTGPLTAHILGYTGPLPQENLDSYLARGYEYDDRIGLTGIELTMEDELRGVKGERHIEVYASGQEKRTLGEQPPVPGHSVYLTIDVELQRTMEQVLRRGMITARSKSGVAIAMNPQSGEILAMVSLPTYDNNLFARGISPADYIKLSEDPNRPLVNHAITGQYPPGSTFKIIPATAALQEKVIDEDAIIHDPGVIYLPNEYAPDNPNLARPFRCWKYDGHGDVNIITGLAWSCDVFFYELGGGYGDFQGLGWERIANYAEAFGMGQPTGIELSGESACLVPSERWKRETFAESWTTGDTYNMAIGQGFVLVTPLQMLNAMAAVANGGTLYRPQIVYQIADVDGNVVRDFEPKVIRQVPVSPENLALVRAGLRAGVEMPGGTATLAHLPNVAIAGKTGTAQYYDPNQRFGTPPTHAWFAGYAPADNPQIALVVFVAGGGEGSKVAVPIAAEILKAYFHLPEEAQPEVPKPTPTPTPLPPATPQFAGRLVKTDYWSSNIFSSVSGRVIDRNGNGMPNMLISIDGGGPPVFQPTTDPTGSFRYDFLNPHVTRYWYVSLQIGDEVIRIPLEVEENKQYFVEFYEVQR